MASNSTETLVNQLLTDAGKRDVITRLEKEYKNFAVGTTEKAAILLPLCVVNGQLSLLFTLRSKALNAHSGEVR